MEDGLKKLVHTLEIIIILTAGCGPVTPYPTNTPIATAFPSVTPTLVMVHPDLEPITRENLDLLDKIDVWGKGNIYDVALAPNGKQIVVYSSRAVYVYDLDTLTETKLIDFDFGLSRTIDHYPGVAAYSSDGTWLALATGGFIGLYSTTPELKYFSDTRIRGNDAPMLDMKFSHDGRSLLTISKYSSARCRQFDLRATLYDLQTWDVLFDKSYCDGLYNVSMPGKIYLVDADHEIRDNKYVEIYSMDVIDSSTGNLLKTEEFFGDVLVPANVTDLVEGRDNLLISMRYTYSMGQTPWIDLYNLRRQESGFSGKREVVKCEFIENVGNIYDWSFLSGNLVSVDGDYIKIWDLSTCRKTSEINFPRITWWADSTFSPDNNVFVVNTFSGYDLMNTNTGETIKYIPLTNSEKEYAFAEFFGFDVSGNRFYSLEKMTNYELNLASKSLVSWDSSERDLVPSSKPVELKTSLWVDSNRRVRGVYTWRQDAEETVVSFFDENSVIPVNTISIPYRRYLAQLYYSADDRYAAMYSVDEPYYSNDSKMYISIVNLTDGSVTQQFEIGRQDLFYDRISVAFSPDFSKVAISTKNYVTIRDVASGAPLSTFAAYHENAKFTARVLSDDLVYNSFEFRMYFSPDGKIFVYEANGDLRFWDAQSGLLIGQIQDLGYGFRSYISDDGCLLAVIHNNGIIDIFGIRRRE
jgi:hypothetical protein